MKTLLLLTTLILSINTFASEVTFCGKLTSVTSENDIWSNYRAGIYNGKEPLKKITVKDEETVQNLALTIDPDAFLDSFTWWHKDHKGQNYWVCVTGDLNQDNFMRDVTDLRVWLNGERVL